MNFVSDESETDYPHTVPIEEHGLIGNMHTVALVTTQATIDWFCYPYFDSPSIFCSLLDSRKGGFFSIGTKCGNLAFFEDFSVH